MAKVFVSHAGEDHLLAAELHGWLIADGHDVFLDQDLRDGIALGEEWEQRLLERLRWADAVVCLVTSAYRESVWCAAEVGIARLKGSRLLPLRAESDEVHPLLMPGRYQYADLLRDPIAARAALRQALYRLNVGGGSGWEDGRSPFPGLRRFDTDLQSVFFGRETEVRQLAARLRSPSDSSNGAMLLVVGPSGCGKSSLVRAGLLPIMARDPGCLPLPPVVPGLHPVAMLARVLARGAKELQRDWTVSSVRARLNDDDGLTALCDDLLVAARGSERSVLLVVDQFEEIHTMASAEARGHFARLLRSALAGTVQVVGTLRPEFLGQLLASPELRDLTADTYALRPLSHDALRTVIEEPARVAGFSVDPGLVTQLVEDTQKGEALPLLAFALARLGEDLPRGGRLSARRYEQLGGVQGALIRQADAALDDAVAVNHRTRDQVISGLLRLVTVNEAGHPVRWLVDRAELAPAIQAELEAFVARRLVTADLQDDGTVALGVTHEAFLTAWPPLAAAINATAAALRARRAVELAASQWDDAGRPSLQLWERGQLAAAVEATGARRVASRLAPTESRSKGSTHIRLGPGHRVVITENVELSARARDFLYLSIRRDRSRRRRATTVLSVLLVLAVTAAAVALIQQRAAQAQQLVAQQQLRIATARELITEADASLADDPFEALQLGIAAQGIEDNAETRASLVTSLISTRYAGVLTAHSDVIAGLAFSPDGKTLASCSEDQKCRLWNFTDFNHPAPLGEPILEPAGANTVAFAPDGTILAVGLVDGTIHLWKLHDAAHPVPFGPPIKAHDGEVRGVGFGDMRTLVTAGEDGMVRVWDLANPSDPSPVGPPLSGHRGIAVRSLAISQNRQIAATGDVDAFVRLWRLDRNHLGPLGPTLKGHSRGMLRSLAFTPDGLSMATVSDDRSVRVWNVANPREARPIGPPLTGHQDEVTSVAFSPKEPVFFTGSDDQNVRGWNLDSTHPTSRGRPLSGAHDEVYSLAFTSDGRLLTAGIRDGTIALWNVSGGTLPAPLGSPLTGHKAGVDPVVFSRSGDLLASASEDMTVKLWQLSPDPSHPSLVASLRHEDEVASVAFSPDQPILATAGEGTVQLWNVARPTSPAAIGHPLMVGDRAVVSLAFCPGRDILMMGDEGGKVRLWQVADPKHPVPLGPALQGNDEEVSSVACSPDGRLFAAAGTAMVKLWGLPDQAPVPLGTFSAGHGQAVNSVTFSPDGEILAAAADDGLVTLWDIKHPRNITPLGPPLRAHGDPVTSVAFSPKDSRIMATTSDDKTVRVWDLTVRELPVPLGPPLEGHQEAVNSVAIGANGIIASGSDDTMVRLWDVRTLEAIRRDPMAYACLRTGRGFSPDEWKSQIPALPYQKTCPN